MLDTDAPLDKLLTVKGYLRLYDHEIVRATQNSAAFGLSPIDITKLILKLHQVISTQIALETSEEWHFQAKNNLLEAHGLYTTQEDLKETVFPHVADIEDLFTVVLTETELDGAGGCVKIPKDLMLLAVNARGEFNPYINAIFAIQKEKAGVSGRSIAHAQVYADIGLRLYSKLSQHILTEDRYNSYLHAFVWESDKVVFERLEELAEDLWHLRMAVHPSRSYIERLLVGLIGHKHETVRDRAIMSLCSYYDSTDWELREPFVPVISTVGSDFTICQLVDEDLHGQDVILMVHSPVCQKYSPRYVLSYHAPEIRSTPKGTLLKVELGTFLKCGFYDWRFVLMKEGLEPVHSGMMMHSSSALKVLQGRFIVHPENIRDLQIHEIFIDFQDAEYDMNSGEYTKRGTFTTVKKSLSDRYSSGINCLYLMGVLERDNGLQLENPKASPFAVTCRQSPCKLLGGDSDFKSLMSESKQVGVKILVDCLARVSSTHYHRRYKGEEFFVMNETGKLVVCYGTDGRAIRYDDTFLLNYRKSSVWNLLVDDVLSFVQKYDVDGIHLDNAHAWPQVLVRNEVEMFRKDPDGEYHFTTQEIFDGMVVQRNEFFGFWQSSARYTYANPLFFKLCKELWKSFPDFIVVADVWSGSGLEDRVSTIPRSGPIPRMYELPVKLASIFGRRLHKNGQVDSIEKRDVSVLKTWYDDRKKVLPEGAIVIQSSTGNSLPYPALLYGKGAWPAAEVLLLMPDIPMTYIGEQDGHVYRTPITHVYTQQANQDASYEQRTGSGINLQEPLTLSTVPQIESAASLSVLPTISDVVKKTSEYQQSIGPDAGFDLTRIKAHYHHRRSLRHQKAVLRYGELVPLIVRHEHGWHKQVLAFARHYKDETAVIVINLTEVEIRGQLDLKNLEKYVSDCSIFSMGLWSDTDTDQFFYREELLKSHHDVVLGPYASQFYGLYPADLDAETTVLASAIRMKNWLDDEKPTDSAILSLKLLELLSNPDAENTFPLIANQLATIQKYLWDTHSIQGLQYFLSLSKLVGDSILAARLYASVSHIAGSAGSHQLKPVCEELVKTMKVGPIVFTCPELGRWSTIGGLGVMVDELSQGLADLGEDVWVISPYYHRNKKGETGYLERDPAGIKWVTNVIITLGTERITLGAYQGKVSGVNVVFLHNEEYFPVPYADGRGAYIIKQLAVWGKATLEFLCAISMVPAMVVTNDWFTALVPAYAKTGAFGTTFFPSTFLHILHNLDPAYEGRIYPARNEGLYENVHFLPVHYLVEPSWTQIIVNPSRCALLASDQWATVSVSYKLELLKGSPLKELLKRKKQPFAHANGIPIKQRLARLKDKGTHETAKAALQNKYLNGNEDPTIPLFGFVGRITEQKGVHMILDAAEVMIPASNFKMQFIVGGPASVTEAYSVNCAAKMKRLREDYPRNFFADPDNFFYDGPLVNLGCDFGLMPSLFEPGGIVQHEFFVAGTPVVAYKTGGLKDSVIEFNRSTQEGSGFVFDRYRQDDFRAAISRAITIYSEPKLYEILRKTAFAATMDGERVSLAWDLEFYRLRERIFADPKEYERYSNQLKSVLWSVSDITTTLPEIKRATGRLKRTLSGSLLLSERPNVSLENIKRHVLFRYTPAFGPKAKSLHLVGSFDNWQNWHEMHFDNTTGRWEVPLQLPKGTYYYKFVVDRWNWVTTPDKPMVGDVGGNQNNVIEVK